MCCVDVKNEYVYIYHAPGVLRLLGTIATNCKTMWRITNTGDNYDWPNSSEQLMVFISAKD